MKMTYFTQIIASADGNCNKSFDGRIPLTEFAINHLLDGFRWQKLP